MSKKGEQSMKSVLKKFGLIRQPYRDIEEPQWSAVLSSPDECAAAAAYWATLSKNGSVNSGNLHSVMRLVTTYIIFDRVSAELMRNQTREAVWSIYREAAEIALHIEQDLAR